MTNTSVTVSELREALVKLHWPKCNALAEEIAKIGGSDAKEALIAALKSRTHHVRSAAIRSLASLGDPTVIPHIEKHLNDSSYETREDAKAAIAALSLKQTKPKVKGKPKE